MIASGDGAALIASGDGATLIASGAIAALIASGDGATLIASGAIAALIASGEVGEESCWSDVVLRWPSATFHVTLQGMPQALPRNDVRQYEELADQWWRPNGAFAMLHWIAEARAALVPKASRPGAVLVDLGCGAGLLAPHVAVLGYRHVGVDLVTSSLLLAGAHGVAPVRGDVNAVPLADSCADVVSAGEILEHVANPSTVAAEACRLLRPGGTLVLDTINATTLARFVTVTLGERIPGGAPKGIHDPNLFVPPRVLVDECATHGVTLRVRGIRPALGQMLRWLLTRRGDVAIVPTSSTAVLYQGWGVKEG